MANQKVGIIETTLRDGQQSLWATRMTTAMMLPVLPAMDRLGFEAIEFMGTAVMDAQVRFLKENPFERMRLVRQQVQRTPLQVIGVSTGFSVGKGATPDDMMQLLFGCCAAAGVDRFFFIDGLNDIRNAEAIVPYLKALGKYVLGAITYSVSPVHTDAHFVAKAKDWVRLGVDCVILKDPNGLLTPERVRTLVPALIKACGQVPVTCHSHCILGLGPATNLDAVRLGASTIWTCAAPLANGISLPATESMVRHLEREGYETGVDAAGLPALSEHWRRVAKRHGKPVGEPAEYNPYFFEHQMPGGMISNFKAQLAQIGLEHRLEEVLDSIPQVREDLGWSLMVTPFSQMIGIQAALNVLYGRYEVVLEEVRKLVLGYYGQTPGPVKPNVLDRCGKGQQAITARPSSLQEPAVARFRQERGPFRDDEDLLLNYFFMPDHLKALYAAGPIATEDRITSASPLVDLVRQVAKARDVTGFRLVKHG